MVLIIGLRLAVRFSTSSPGIDDILAVLAMFMAIGSTITISLAVNDGLGQKDIVRDLSKTGQMQKNVFASSLLYILTLLFAKLSTVVLAARLCAQRSHRVVIYGVLGFSIAWGLAAVFADAFRCPLSETYDLYGPACADIFSFWNAVSSLDIASDLVLILLPIYLFRSLQMRLLRKLIVMAAFGCRVFVVILAIVRLVYLNITFKASPPAEQTFNAIPYQICTQVQQALAVMVAAAPALKAFLDKTSSGMFAVSLSVFTGTTYGKDSYIISNLNSSSAGSATRSRHRSTVVTSTVANVFTPDQIQSTATVTTAPRLAAVRVSRTGSDFCHKHIDVLEAASRMSAVPPLFHSRERSLSYEGSGERVGYDGAMDHASDGASDDQMIIQVQRDWKVEYDSDVRRQQRLLY
ncbi:uncharacterized protein AB675_4537 [Cyphellophora attinorum]|uniref:Rhodopsin domain-containing protein n=1 Tax=Cyphellophora attinorum TaxID=1664694 RepID=A0A0N1H336_9EURO|nr:uncharacterized protein AB675_4537 [Phialophora attinorum]KPI39142.1 hypothetical protein AB675_4537 [Phialophora attinorum]